MLPIDRRKFIQTSASALAFTALTGRLEAIPITRQLGARVILLPFFGKGALQTKAEMDYVGDFLKEIGPEAEKTGVILGLENTNSAEDNARILDRAQSKAVLVYYDVGN